MIANRNARPLKLIINDKTFSSFKREYDTGIKYLTNICSSLQIFVVPGITEIFQGVISNYLKNQIPDYLLDRGVSLKVTRYSNYKNTFQKIFKTPLRFKILKIQYDEISNSSDFKQLLETVETLEFQRCLIKIQRI